MVTAERLGSRIKTKETGEQLPNNIIDFYSKAAAHMALAVSLATSIENGLSPSQRRQIIELGLLDKKNYSTLRTVNNVVRGEKFMAKYKPGAVAAIAVTKEGIKSMPKNFGYVNILAGPPQADRRILSLGRIHQDRLQGLIGISISPGRDISKQSIDDCGIMSIIRAATEARNKKDGPYGDFVVAGQIHSTEALIAAAAVKALGGFMDFGNSLLSLENLVPGNQQEIAVYVGLITDDHYFGKPGVIKGGNGSFFVTTAIITHEGINFKSINIESPGTVTRHF